MVLAIASAIAFVAMNWLHYWMYAATGGWDSKGVLESVLLAVPPQDQQGCLANILEVSRIAEPVGIEHYLDIGRSLIPRVLWPGKPPSFETGTLAIQSWSGQSIDFQMAITDVGEAIAAFGDSGLIVLAFPGLLYGIIDRALYSGWLMRSAVLSSCLARVFSDQGMGASALLLTLAGLISSLAILAPIYWVSSPPRGPSRKVSAGSAQVSPDT